MLDVLLPEGLSPATAGLLVAVSFFTSALTAAFGIGGGVAMLGALAGTVSPAVIVAVHALVQVGSNTGRALVQRRFVDWPTAARFVGGSVVGVGLGGVVFTALPERALLAVLGGFILLMVFVPKPDLSGLAGAGALLGGVISSALTMFVGATGPFVQAVLLPMKFDRRGLIATHAVCMSAQHALKVVAFGLLGVPLAGFLPLIAAMISAGFLGTLAGTRLLEAFPERLFQRVLQVILTVVALDLLRRAAF